MCIHSLKRFGIFPLVVLLFEAFESSVGEKIFVLEETIKNTTIRATKEVTRRSLRLEVASIELFSRTHGITQRAVNVAEVTEASLLLAPSKCSACTRRRTTTAEILVASVLHVKIQEILQR